MVRYRATILILLVFCIDLLTGNWLDIVKPAPADDIRDWYNRFALAFLAQKSYFSYVPYIMLGAIYINSRLIRPVKIVFEFPDLLLIFGCLTSCVITSWDYADNNNTRPEWLDWQAFIITFTIIIILKIVWKKLQRRISKILI